MPPPNVGTLFERPQLLARLGEGLRKPLVVIHAPAGYGKTSAAALAVHHSGLPCAWYLAQPWHAGDFIEPLVGAVREVREDFGRLTIASAQANAPQGQDRKRRAQRLGATFAQDLSNQPEPLLLVFDDLHLLGDDRDFPHFFAALLRALPAHLHVLLLARVLPPIPLAQALAADRATAFDAFDLRFNVEETLALASVTGTPLDPVSAQRLCEVCEGWPTGIALSLSLGGKLIPSAQGLQNALGVYLLEELIAEMPPQVCAFLERTAVLESLDTALLEIGGITDARERLAQCERLGTMIEVLEAGKRYRIHPLLRETLLRRVQNSRGEPALAEAHRWAAGLYEGASRPRPALYHYREAQDAQGIACVLRAHAFELIAAGQGNFVQDVLGGLPADVGEAALRPFVLGLLAKQRGGTDAGEFFENARNKVTDQSDDRFRFAIEHQLAEQKLSELHAPAERDIAALLARSQRLGAAEQGDALAVAGWTALMRGDIATARKRASQAMDCAAAGTTAHFRGTILAAYVATILTEFEHADALLGSLLRSLEDSDRLALQSSTLEWYARLSLLWGDSIGALEYALQAERLSRQIGVGSALAAVYFAIIEAYAHAGDAQAVREAVAQMHQHAELAWYITDRKRAHIFAEQYLARAEYLAGDSRRALVLAEQLLEKPDLSAVQFALVATDVATYARISAQPTAESARDRACRLLEAAQPVDAAEAVATADAAELLGMRCTHNPLFAGLIERRRAMRERTPHFQTRILCDLARVTNGAPGITASQSAAFAPHEALTKRESEILELLTAGLTNKEMAARLVLSPRTVESHVERVLGKLGVTSRSRAVATALRTGLVAGSL